VSQPGAEDSDCEGPAVAVQATTGERDSDREGSLLARGTQRSRREPESRRSAIGE